MTPAEIIPAAFIVITIILFGLALLVPAFRELPKDDDDNHDGDLFL